MRACAIATISALAALGWAPLHAQQVRGQVLSSSDSGAVAGAVIQLRQGDAVAVQAITDSAGSFRLTAPGPGEYVVHVQHPDFPAVSRELTLARQDDVFLEVMLNVGLIPLEPIRVVATRSAELTGVGGYYDRLDYYGNLGLGRFITRETLDAGGPQNPSAYLGRVPFVALRAIRSSSTLFLPVFRQRGRGECVPAVYYDGKPISALQLDEVYGAAPLEGIEIYRGAQGPAIYSDPGGCGVILVWSRRDVAEGGVGWLRGRRGVAALAAFLVAALLLVR